MALHRRERERLATIPGAVGGFYRGTPAIRPGWNGAAGSGFAQDGDNEQFPYAIGSHADSFGGFE
jgi:hypothetical protein